MRIRSVYVDPGIPSASNLVRLFVGAVTSSYFEIITGTWNDKENPVCTASFLMRLFGNNIVASSKSTRRMETIGQ